MFIYILICDQCTWLSGSLDKYINNSKNINNLFHLGFDVDFLFMCIYFDLKSPLIRHVVRVCQRNIVRCAVQTNATLLGYALMTAKQRNVGTCWIWSLTSFKLHPTTSNKPQQLATTRNMVCVCTGLYGFTSFLLLFSIEWSQWYTVLQQSYQNQTHHYLQAISCSSSACEKSL